MSEPLEDNAWREGYIKPPEGGGMPERFRLLVERFAQGCEVCGVMSWRCIGADENGAIYGCTNCGNVFDVPVVEADNA